MLAFESADWDGPTSAGAVSSPLMVWAKEANCGGRAKLFPFLSPLGTPAQVTELQAILGLQDPLQPTPSLRISALGCEVHHSFLIKIFHAWVFCQHVCLYTPLMPDAHGD